MYKKKLIKFMVLTLSILMATLVANNIDNFIQSHYKQKFSPHTFTLIGMGLVLLIYYPLFTWLDKWASSFANTFLKAGKQFGGSVTGSFLAFLLGLLVLYYFYGQLWFDKNVYASIYHAIVARLSK